MRCTNDLLIPCPEHPSYEVNVTGTWSAVPSDYPVKRSLGLHLNLKFQEQLWSKPPDPCKYSGKQRSNWDDLSLIPLPSAPPPSPPGPFRDPLDAVTNQMGQSIKSVYQKSSERDLRPLSCAPILTRSRIISDLNHDSAIAKRRTAGKSRRAVMRPAGRGERRVWARAFVELGWVPRPPASPVRMSWLDKGAMPQAVVPDIAALRKQAEAGDKNAAFNLAEAYRSGLVIEIDLPEAAKWYAKSAAAGHAPAMTRLGVLYLVGKSVQRNDLLALQLLSRGGRAGRAPGYGNTWEPFTCRDAAWSKTASGRRNGSANRLRRATPREC